MNEFAAKKLGEVLAFCRVGVETFERGKDAFAAGLGVTGEAVDQIIAELNEHAGQIETVAKNAGMESVTMTKAEGTGNKLRAMRDLYVGDEWDNPAELLEWSGFFEGAAIVHWALVEGAGKGLNDKDLEGLADGSKDYHEDLLEQVEEALEKLGETRSQQ